MGRVHFSVVIPFPRTLPVPDEVLEIARRLEEAGFETWCVGGAVRDNLLKQGNRDFDLATAATPDKVQQLFRRTVPVGVEHGTVAVLDRRKDAHEVTTFRRDVRTDGRHAVVEFATTLDEDLARRDFTINAIAYHPLKHEWKDLHEGRIDLERRLIRAVGDPETRFREDYLRILRGLRFAARFDFAFDPPTWAAARAAASSLDRLSAERVRDEWFRALESAHRPSKLVELWAEVGAMPGWLPEVRPDRGPTLDQFERRDPVLMTAFLSSDPPATLTRLRCSNAEIARGRAISEAGAVPDPMDKIAVRRWMSANTKAVDDLLTLFRATDPRRATLLDAAVANVRATGVPMSLSELAVTGDDLQRIGLPPGRGMGKILRTLLDEVIEDRLRNDSAALLDRARQLGESR